MKTKITREFLLKEYRSTMKVFLFSIFVIAGLFCFICPVFYCKELGNLLANMAFMLIIAVPFCWIGMKNILGIIRRNKNIRYGDISIIEDFVVRKRMLQHGASSDTSDDYCQLDFKKYSKESGKTISVRRSVYNETHTGDMFYMVYVNNELFGFYPASKYEIP